MIGRLALAVIAATMVPMLALGADRPLRTAEPSLRAQHVYSPRVERPYPLSRRAKKIRLADRCWRGCLADTGRDFQACLRAHRPTVCVSWNAGANLHCLDECRLGGGPWVRLE
jgi:hypothetical protein